MLIDPLVKPRSVAIVGATDRPGPGRTIIESLGKIGFTGPIYPVNPKYQTVLNMVCYPSLTELPEGDIPSGQTGVESSMLKEERRGLVKRAIDDLPTKDRELLKRIFLDEHDKDVVCREFNVSRDYLRVLLHRARARLRAALYQGRGEAAG